MDVYVTMPFLKKLHLCIMPRPTEKGDRGEFPMFDCGRLITVINRLDSSQPEWTSVSPEPFVVTREPTPTPGGRAESETKTNSRKQSRMQSKRPTSPIINDAIEASKSEGFSLAKQYNEILLLSSSKARQLRQLEDEHEVLVRAEQELHQRSAWKGELKGLQNKVSEIEAKVYYEQQYKAVVGHMLRRENAIKTKNERSTREAKHVLERYRNASILKAVQKARQDDRKARAALRIAVAAFKNTMESQHGRLHERLQLVVDGMTARELQEANVQRKVAIKSGLFYDPDRSRSARKHSEHLAKLEASEARLKILTELFNRLYTATGTSDTDALVSRFVNIPTNKQMAERRTAELEERIVALQKEESGLRQMFVDVCVTENEDAENDSHTQAHLHGAAASQRFETQINEISSRLNACRRRGQLRNEQYQTLRAMLASIFARIRTMMLQCGVSTEEVDVGLESIIGEDMFLNVAPSLANLLSAGINKCGSVLLSVAKAVSELTESSKQKESDAQRAAVNNVFGIPSVEFEDSGIPASPIHSRMAHVELMNKRREERERELQGELEGVYDENAEGSNSLPVKARAVVRFMSERKNIVSVAILREEQDKRTTASPTRTSPTRRVGLADQTVPSHEMDQSGNVAAFLQDMKVSFNIMDAELPSGINVRVKRQEHRIMKAAVLDLVANMKSVLNEKKISPKQFFKKLDIDDSQSITKEELWDGLKQYGITWTTSQFDLIYERFNSNNDDGLDEDEFLRVFDPEHVERILKQTLTFGHIVTLKDRSHKLIHERLVKKHKERTVALNMAENNIALWGNDGALVLNRSELKKKAEAVVKKAARKASYQFGKKY
jgi:hypothetical protein